MRASGVNCAGWVDAPMRGKDDQEAPAFETMQGSSRPTTSRVPRGEYCNESQEGVLRKYGGMLTLTLIIPVYKGCTKGAQGKNPPVMPLNWCGGQNRGVNRAKWPWPEDAGSAVLPPSYAKRQATFRAKTSASDAVTSLVFPSWRAAICGDGAKSFGRLVLLSCGRTRARQAVVGGVRMRMRA